MCVCYPSRMHCIGDAVADPWEGWFIASARNVVPRLVFRHRTDTLRAIPLTAVVIFHAHKIRSTILGTMHSDNDSSVLNHIYRTRITQDRWRTRLRYVSLGFLRYETPTFMLNRALVEVAGRYYGIIVMRCYTVFLTRFIHAVRFLVAQQLLSLFSPTALFGFNSNWFPTG